MIKHTKIVLERISPPQLEKVIELLRNFLEEYEINEEIEVLSHKREAEQTLLRDFLYDLRSPYRSTS